LIVDLRSDTVTRPTPEMRTAMAEADVGDDAYGEDPTVARLESLAAALLGKEAALYVPSGTMANQIALRVLGVPGTEVLCGARAHVYRHERAATAMNAGVQLHVLPDAGGRIVGDDVAHALASGTYQRREVSAVFVENTNMAASGRPANAAEIADVADVAHAHGLPVHCDGARIWNAAVALGVSPSALVEACDTVMFCLSKGLAAPVGSVLCGDADRIHAARVERARLGGQMRQAGVIAAAGVVALESMVERLADDHARAARLAAVLAECFPGSVDPTAVRTNIVCAAADALPDDLLEQLAGAEVLAGMLDVDTARFVMHKDVDDDGVEQAIGALRRIAGRD
jgi:threonine aldolase